MAELKKIKKSMDDFKVLRESGNNYYVDKTSFIKEVVSVKESAFDVNLVLRPRRFGKTLNQTMLRSFFDIDEKDSAPLFEGLEISKDKELCKKYQNKIPVVFLSFKLINGSDMNQMLRQFNDCIGPEFVHANT